MRGLDIPWIVLDIHTSKTQLEIRPFAYLKLWPMARRVGLGGFNFVSAPELESICNLGLD